MATTATILPFRARQPRQDVPRTNGALALDTQRTPPIQIGRQSGPRPGEDTICQWVQGLYIDAAHARERIIAETEWETLQNGYWGNTWPAILPSYKSPISANELKHILLQEWSDLTDMQPTVYVTSDMGTGKRDTDVEQALQAYWQRNFLDMVLLEASVDASVWPCGFIEVLWDQLAPGGQGEVRVRARHPRSVYPDPYATSEDDWRYVIIRETMDVHEVRQRWPEHGWRAKPDVVLPSSVGALYQEGPFQGRGASMLSPLYPVAAPVPSGGSDNRTTVYTCYVQDSSTHEVPYAWKDAQGMEHLDRRMRRTYPNGRLIQCTSTVCLYEGANPYPNGFPLVRVTLQPTVHSFWAYRSIVAELLELQRSSDKLESLILENALRMQKAFWIVDAHAGVDGRSFGDLPGQVVPVTPGAQVRDFRPPPMPADLVQHPERLRQQMRNLMGQTAQRMGQGQRGNVSAELTETDISQSMGLTRLHARYLHLAAVKTVQKLFATMAQFYRTPRLLPYCMDEGWKPVMWQPIGNREKYLLHVDPNSFVVQSKTMIKRLALALARMNKMPTEDLLKTLEFPKAQEIAQRLHQELQLAAAARAQQGGKKGRR